MNIYVHAVYVYSLNKHKINILRDHEEKIKQKVVLGNSRMQGPSRMQVLRKKHLMDNYTKEFPCELVSLLKTMIWGWACDSRNKT